MIVEPNWLAMEPADFRSTRSSLFRASCNPKAPLRSLFVEQSASRSCSRTSAVVSVDRMLAGCWFPARLASSHFAIDIEVVFWYDH